MTTISTFDEVLARDPDRAILKVRPRPPREPSELETRILKALAGGGGSAAVDKILAEAWRQYEATYGSVMIAPPPAKTDEPPATPPGDQIDELAKQKIAKNAKLTYRQAVDQTMAENPALAKAWRDLPRVGKMQPDPREAHVDTSTDLRRPPDASPATPTKAGAEIDRFVRALRDKRPELTYREALDLTLRERPDLWEQHRGEMNTRSDWTGKK